MDEEIKAEETTTQPKPAAAPVASETAATESINPREVQE